jgi:hypothetical protein
LFPRLLMPNNFDLPPVEYCLGTSPSHAAISRPPLKIIGLPTHEPATFVCCSIDGVKNE